MQQNPIFAYLDKHEFITLDHYMQLCLQSHDNGYYRTGNPIGRLGDFTTAPEISQIFGELIGIFIQFHKATLFPNSYQICELGAGKGTLATDYLRVLNTKEDTKPDQMFFLESNANLITQQKNNHPTSHHIQTISDLPPKPTLFIANEFFDALPIKAYKLFGAEMAELIIRKKPNNTLKFEHNPPVKNISGRIHGYYEQSNQAFDFYHAISDHIKHHQGALLMCDYGYNTPLEKTTFRGYYKHTITDGLQTPCQEDLTADIDFSQVTHYFLNNNLCVSDLLTQADFLKDLHIQTRLHKLLGMISDKKAKEALIQGVQKLIAPSEMGDRFKFLCVNTLNAPLYPFKAVHKL